MFGNLCRFYADRSHLWFITLPIKSNSSTVKHTAGSVTLHQNIFEV